MTNERPTQLNLPVELWYYFTEFRDSDKDKLLSRSNWNELREYEPSKMHGTYEAYVHSFESRDQQMQDCKYSLRKVVITKETMQSQCDAVEAEPDFVGWFPYDSNSGA